MLCYHIYVYISRLYSYYIAIYIYMCVYVYKYIYREKFHSGYDIAYQSLQLTFHFAGRYLRYLGVHTTHLCMEFWAKHSPKWGSSNAPGSSGNVVSMRIPGSLSHTVRGWCVFFDGAILLKWRHHANWGQARKMCEAETCWQQKKCSSMTPTKNAV